MTKQNLPIETKFCPKQAVFSAFSAKIMQFESKEGTYATKLQLATSTLNTLENTTLQVRGDTKETCQRADV